MRCLLSFVLLSLSLLAQGGGRFEENKRLGLAALRDGKYERAAAKLEEVYEADPNDALIAESLAIAYMNSEERKQDRTLDEKAYKILARLLEKGGRAVFHVQLNLSSTFYGSSITKFCSGPLIVEPGKLTFQCEKGDVKPEYSFTMVPAEIKETGDHFDKGRGMFYIKGLKKTYNFYPASWDKTHSQMILEFVRQYVR